MRYIAIICLFAFGLLACNTPTKDEERIDFTKSYETAAMALTDAQLAYDVAVASNDTTRIAAAKAQLESAKTSYLESKTYYSANGGVVKDEYEQLLAITNTSLGKAPDDTTTTAPALPVTKPVIDLSGTPIAIAKKILDSGTRNASKKVQRVSDAITTSEKAINQGVAKTNENLTKVRDTTKKRIDEFKRQADAVKNLFKRPVDTSKKN